MEDTPKVVPQITTQHVGTWGSPTHRWTQGGDGKWSCVEVAPLNVGESDAEERTEQGMPYVAPRASGLHYAGGPVKDPR